VGKGEVANVVAVPVGDLQQRKRAIAAIKVTQPSGNRSYGRRPGGLPIAAQERSAPTRVSGCRSAGSVVELWEVERPHPRLAGPREDLGLRREPLVEAIESAFLHVNDAGSVFRLLVTTLEPQLVQKTRSSPWSAHVSVFGP
jgi:hypothetical protein